MNEILVIGTLPVEAGGRYTNGICNVVYELSKYPLDEFSINLFAINAPAAKVRKLNVKNGVNYIGYTLNIFVLLYYFLNGLPQNIRICKELRRTTQMNYMRCLFYVIQLKRILKITKPNIIHSHVLYMPYVAYALKEKSVKLVQTYHGLFIGTNNCIKLIEDYQPYIDYATGLTSETCERILDRGFKKNQIFQISNGVDISKFFYSERKRQTIRSQFSLLDDTLLFITVASISERKGQLNFIKIFEQLEGNFQYWIIGTGPDINVIEHYITCQNLTGKVKIIGYVPNDELYQYYSAADIYVHSSEEEGQALSEIEAYTTGLRVLANEKLKGTIVNDINDTYLYHFYNPLCPNIQSMSSWIILPSGKRETTKKFDWEKISVQYNEMYKTIIQNNE